MAFLVGGLSAASMAGAQSLAVPAEAQRRTLQLAAEALRAGEITAAQHADLVRWTAAKPCRGVRTTLSQRRRGDIADAVSVVQKFPGARVLGYFEVQGWYIVYTNASPGDEQYLVYDRDPVGRVTARTSWSGAATMFETTEVRDWLLAAAPNIPKRLADCFAWHVTLGRRDGA